jgi:hypothetical protein
VGGTCSTHGEIRKKTFWSEHFKTGVLGDLRVFYVIGMDLTATGNGIVDRAQRQTVLNMVMDLRAPFSKE